MLVLTSLEQAKLTKDDVWWRFCRTVEDIQIFAVDLSPEPNREAIALDLLDALEIQRYSAYQIESARRTFLLSRAALRLLLGHRLNRPADQFAFETSRYGKLYVVLDDRPAAVSFNVTHSGSDGLIALTPFRDVGIDLEHANRHTDLEGAAMCVLGASEQAALARMAGAARTRLFYRLWTCKEALIKAKGTGFYCDPSRFEVPEDILLGASSAFFGFPEDAVPAWKLLDLSNDW